MTPVPDDDATPTELPVPRPLPAAVAAGKFGHDEDGSPIDPDPDEVWAITDAQAERLAGLVADRDEAVRRRLGAAEVERRDGQVTQAVRDYAEDFGDEAAGQLLAHATRQAKVEARPGTSDRGR